MADIVDIHNPQAPMHAEDCACPTCRPTPESDLWDIPGAEPLGEITPETAADSDVMVCDICGSPDLWCRRDGSITCSTPLCMAVHVMRWFNPLDSDESA